MPPNCSKKGMNHHHQGSDLVCDEMLHESSKKISSLEHLVIYVDTQPRETRIGTGCGGTPKTMAQEVSVIERQRNALEFLDNFDLEEGVEVGLDVGNADEELATIKQRMDATTTTPLDVTSSKESVETDPTETTGSGMRNDESSSDGEEGNGKNDPDDRRKSQILLYQVIGILLVGGSMMFLPMFAHISNNEN